MLNLNAKILSIGLPTMGQWVKNLTAAPRVAAEVLVRYPAGHGVLKDPALPQL